MECKQELINQIKKTFKGIENPIAYANYLTSLCTKEYLRISVIDEITATKEIITNENE